MAENLLRIVLADLISPSRTPSVPYQKMYTTLFNAITDALCLIDDGNLVAAKALLKRAQQATEELYISQK